MRFILFACLMVLFSCCDDDPENGLTGDWNWRKSSGGFAGAEYTPESTGETQRITITSDSIIFYRNDIRLSAQPYHTESREVAIGDRNEDWIIMITPVFEYHADLQGGHLWLTELCPDCFGHYYTRR